MCILNQLALRTHLTQLHESVCVPWNPMAEPIPFPQHPELPHLLSHLHAHLNVQRNLKQPRRLYEGRKRSRDSMAELIQPYVAHTLNRRGQVALLQKKVHDVVQRVPNGFKHNVSELPSLGLIEVALAQLISRQKNLDHSQHTMGPA